jgi:hypothetical protein
MRALRALGVTMKRESPAQLASSRVVQLALKSLLPPPHQAGIGRVLRIVDRAWRHALVDLAHVDLLREAGQLLSNVANSTADADPVESVALLTGQRRRHAAWFALATMSLGTGDKALRLIGRELMLSVLQQRRARATVIRLSIDAGRLGAEAAIGRLDRYTQKITQDIKLIAQTPNTPGRIQLLRSRILSAYAAQIEPKNLEDRKHAGSVRHLSLAEIKEACAAIRADVDKADATALAIAIAICTGPTLDVVLDIPFGPWAEGSPAAIDVVTGVAHIDLSGLRHLARWQVGHEVAAPRIEVALPCFISTALQRLVSSNWAVKSLRDVLDDVQDVTGRTRVMLASGRTVSVGRLVRSRARPLIEAGFSRAIAAYCTGDLSLIGPAANHYLTLPPSSIYEANVARYSSLAWGPPVLPINQREEVAVGSRATPTKSVVRLVESHFQRHVQDSRAGRRYTWQTLAEAHNSYALICAHRSAFFTAARAARRFNLYASDIHVGIGQIGLADKRTTSNDMALAIPISTRFAEQLRLWRLHLGALKRRLVKLNSRCADGAIDRIESIERSAQVREFFLICADGQITDIGSQDLAAVHPDLQLKGDWRRHYLCAALTMAGVPFRLVEGHLRHAVRGSTDQALTSALSRAATQSRLASEIDRIALEVGIDPVGGLINV